MQQSVQANRISEGGEGVGFEGAAGLFRVRGDGPRVQADQRRPFLVFCFVREERVEAPAEAAPPEGAGRRRIGHTGLGMPAPVSTAPWMRASRFALSSR